MKEDRTSEVYWDDRVLKNKNDLNRMVWYSEKIQQQLMWVAEILEPYRKMTVLDMGCGWGRAAYLFDNDKYLGVDFSQEMVKLAQEKNPGYTFQKGDGRNYVPMKRYDIIMMFHMSGAQELVEKYKPYANFAVIVVGANDVCFNSIENYS